MAFRIDFPISEEDRSPAVTFDCPDCGGEMQVDVAAIRTSTPLECPSCVCKRFVTYKEFLYIQDKCSILLLESAILRLKGPRRRLD